MQVLESELLTATAVHMSYITAKQMIIHGKHKQLSACYNSSLIEEVHT